MKSGSEPQWKSGSEPQWKSGSEKQMEKWFRATKDKSGSDPQWKMLQSHNGKYFRATMKSGSEPQ